LIQACVSFTNHVYIMTLIQSFSEEKRGYEILLNIKQTTSSQRKKYPLKKSRMFKMSWEQGSTGT